MSRADFPLKYESLADKVNSLIDEGVYEPGERLPSIRELHGQFGVSINTVREAYRVLENRGVVEAVRQSGHFVRMGPPICDDSLDGSSASVVSAGPVEVGDTTQIERLLRDMGDPGVRSVSTAEPSESLLPGAHLAREMSRVMRSVPTAIARYGTPEGPLELRQEIAKRMFRAGFSLGPDQIVVTSGCLEAASMALRAVTEPGDTILIESPAFYMFFPLCRHLRLKVIEVPSRSSDGVDPDALEQAVRDAPPNSVRAALLTANFTNPTGALVPDTAKERIAGILSTNGITLVEDDIYGELHYGRARPKALGAFTDPELTYYCSSFSKTLAPGLRIGWVASPRADVSHVRGAKMVTSFVTATPNALTVAGFLSGGDFDRTVRRARLFYQRNAALIREAVYEAFPSGTRATRPAGGLVFWVSLPEAVDSEVLFQRALAEGYVFSPGSVFTMSRNYRSHMRLSARRFDDEDRQAIVRIGALAKELAT